MKMIPTHPMAQLFPKMDKAEYSALLDDMKENGQREPITLHEGKILDGRNRFDACVKLGLKPKTRKWDGKGSLMGFVVSMNINRRHLTTVQRADVAYELSKFSVVGNPSITAPAVIGTSESVITQSDAADMLDVSVDSVQRIGRIKENAVSSVTKAAMSEQIPMSVASVIAGLPTQKQMKVMAHAKKSGEVSGASVRAAMEKIAPPKPVVKPKKSGEELSSPKSRKLCRDLFGKLIRAMDKAGLSGDKKVDAALEVIAQAVKQ